jgi:transposase
MDEQYQEEIVRQHVRRRIRIGKGRCRRCRRPVRGRHPLQTSDAVGAAAAQVGPEAQALIVFMNKDLGVPHKKIAKFLRHAYDLRITPSGVTQVILRAGQRCLPTYRDIRGYIRRHVEVYADETGWRVAAHLNWLWAFVTRDATAYVIRNSRGSEVLEEVLGADYAGFLGHDGWIAYESLKKALHGTCNTHLLGRCRNLLAVARAGAARFPLAVKSILQTGLIVRDRRDAGEISPQGATVAAGRLAARLAHLVNGRITHPDNRRFAKHLRNRVRQIFTYLQLPGVEAANWMGEQAIRPAVVNRKVWGGSRTDAGAAAQSCLMSILRTCAQRGLDSVEFIQRTLRAPPGQHPRLAFVPT